MEQVVQGFLMVILAIAGVTVVTYALVHALGWSITTLRDIWGKIIDKAYYEVWLPVYGVIKWFWIIPHKTLKVLRVYALLGILYRYTVKVPSRVIEKKLRQKLQELTNRVREKYHRGKHQNQQENRRKEQNFKGEQKRQEQKEEPKKEQTRKSPHEILGVSPYASPEEIKKAYRELSQQYHPDKVNHLGQELRELANQKFLEINRAYEDLKK